jgi:hypothetical protein
MRRTLSGQYPASIKLTSCKRVFAIDMERCPVCQQGRLRIIAAITDRKASFRKSYDT